MRFACNRANTARADKVITTELGSGTSDESFGFSTKAVSAPL
jgi:hypothetical protein